MNSVPNQMVVRRGICKTGGFVTTDAVLQGVSSDCVMVRIDGNTFLLILVPYVDLRGFLFLSPPF
jgi:hypothetical protein